MISYVNGDYVTKPVVSVFDRGFVIGDGVYDSARTFGGRIFKLDQHLERLSRSMRYIEIDPDPYASEIRRATEEVVARNMEDILAVGDAWVIQLITRGLLEDAGEFGFGLEEDPPGASRPTIVVIVRPLNFKAFGLLYRDGVDLGVSLLTPFHERTVRSAGEVDRQGHLVGFRLRAASREHGSGCGSSHVRPRRRHSKRVTPTEEFVEDPRTGSRQSLVRSRGPRKATREPRSRA